MVGPCSRTTGVANLVMTCLFRWRATRVLNAEGLSVLRHWCLSGERWLAGARVAVWVWDETATIEYASDT